MSVTQALIAFTIAAGILTITPGLDTALVLRTAAVEGPRRGMLAGLGICLGTLLWAVVTSAGLGAIFLASQRVYDTIRWAGALYLAYLGIKLLVETFRGKPGTPGIQAATDPPPSGNWFVRGLMSNLLNPKVGVFYVTFLPQFIPTGVNVFGFSTLLASIHAVQGFFWFLLICLATQRFATILSRTSFRRALDRILGVVFLGFAFNLAFRSARN